MKPDRSIQEIAEAGMELERILNYLTAQAEVAVHSNDPIQQFHRNVTDEFDA